MKGLLTFSQFLSEAFLFEEDKKAKSKIHPDLDMPQRHDWVEKIMDREWDKEHGDELKNAGEDKEKIKEIRERMKKDPKFGPEYAKYQKDTKRFDSLKKKLNKAGGLENFKKSNPKEYEEILDLQANVMGPVTLSQKPGGVLQITTQDMDTHDDEGELAAEAFREKMKKYIDKNGKPKGVIMDLRSNTGGSQETAKGITDFFVDQDNYTIEKQRYSSAVRRYRDLPYPEGLEKALAYMEEPKFFEKVEKMSDEEKREYWEKSKKDGDLSYQNDRKNKVDKNYRLGDVPIVVQTSKRTFSAGEFTADTIKNLNPNTVHVGHNSGGGSNQTFGAFDDDEWDNAKKSSTEKAKIVAKSFKNAYWNEEDGKKIYDSILKKIDSGEINDKMSLSDIAAATKKAAFDVTGDAHIDVSENPDKPGSILSGVPQVKSDRVVVDPKTKKPVLKNGEMQFDGNWEQKGVGGDGVNTGVFVESDPDKATQDALEFIYQKNGDKKLLKELKSDPEKFGLNKDGKDDVFNSESESKQSYFVNSGDERQAKELKDSIKKAKENLKKGSIADVLIKTQNEIKTQKGKDEIKDIEDTGASKLFAGLEPTFVEKLRKMKVVIAMPDGKKKQIQTDTLMDFIPIDPADFKEQAMIKAQAAQYARINDVRVKGKLKKLAPFEVWMKRRIELAKDNKDYQARVKAKAMKKMRPKPTREGVVSSFDFFLAEEENNLRFNEIVSGIKKLND